MKKVAIIDFDMGNLFSVQHACSCVGLSPIITFDHDLIMKADAAILPGVGAFGSAMKNITRLGLTDTIRSFIDTGKPFMGICLGFQLLFSKSNEFGECNGLDCIKGEVLRFPSQHEEHSLRVPFVGWNQIYVNNKEWDYTPLSSIKNGAYMYFVHSYYVKPSSNKDVLSITKYDGFKYCSSIMHKNIFAAQFHPEKSGIEGIKIYKRWAEKI